MKKLMVLVLMTLCSSVFAREVICVDDFNSESPTVAQFKNIGTKEAFVELFIPKDETEGSTYTALCSKDKTAIEFSVSCNVMTSTDSGYQVRLYSKGGAELTATVTRWNMIGSQKPKTLSCDDAEE